MPDNSFFQVLTLQEETKTIQADKNGQDAEIQFQGMSVNFEFSDGSRNHINIMMLYDPKTGLFGWHFFILHRNQMATPYKTQYKAEFACLLENNSIYLTENKMVYFKYYPCSQIDYKEFTERYASLEIGREKLLLFIQNNLEELDKHSGHDWYSQINLILCKDVSFLFTTRKKKRGSGLVIPYKEIKLVNVTYQNAQWKLTLESADHKQTFLTLDENYQLIEVSGYRAMEEEHYDEKVYDFARID